MTLNQLPMTASAMSASGASSAAIAPNSSNFMASSRSYTYSLSHTSTVTLNNVSMAGSSSTAAINASSMYTSTTNLNFYDEQHCQAQIEKKEFMKLLAQGICNVKCITEYVRFYTSTRLKSTIYG